jgi:hypothetical protein
MADKVTIHRRITPIKKRSQSAYNNKVKKITNWYRHLLKCREREVTNPNTKCPVKRKDLKPLDYYIGLLRKAKE